MKRSVHPALIVVLVAAVVGLVFAGLSTYDFVQHLDRQIHSLHCSFIPGLGKETGESGCQVAMMSPYSSLFRRAVWGGVPISLPAMSVFAFLAFFAIDLIVTRRKDDPRATAFLALATALPAAMSLVMAVISLSQLGTTCKLCVAIYAASGIALVAAIVLWRRAVRLHAGDEPIARRSKAVAVRDESADPAWAGGRGPRARAGADPAFASTERSGSGTAVDPAADPSPADASGRLAVGVDAPVTSTRFLVIAFGIGLAFVALPVALYLARAPDHGRFVGTCDSLPRPADTYGVLIDLDAHASGTPAIEVLDPLCPACRAFEQRLAAAGLDTALDRKAVLFPLDNTCNWMVTEATHPGACTVSEAVLCAGARASEVLAWSFEHQDEILRATRQDATAAGTLVKARFPELAACVGSPEAKSRLNKSLRWSVANNIRVLTPQLFIGGVKLCDEDVDLGLAFAAGILIDRHAAGTLGATPVEAATGSGWSGASGSGSGAAGAAPGTGAETSTTSQPATDKPATKKPSTDTPADKPAADKPPSDKPPTEAGDEPTDQPADQPTADPPAEGPVTSPTDTTGSGGAP